MSLMLIPAFLLSEFKLMLLFSLALLLCELFACWFTGSRLKIYRYSKSLRARRFQAFLTVTLRIRHLAALPQVETPHDAITRCIANSCLSC